MYFDVNNDGAVNVDDVNALVDVINHGAGEPGDVVTFRLEATDLSGNPITSIAAGDEFELHVYTEDSQDVAPRDEFGVFAAYLDVEYNAGLASVVGDITYSESYDSGRLGDTSVAGIIDEAGAFRSSFQPSGRGEFEVFSVRMRADSPGTLQITSNPADNVPTTGVGVYSSDDLVANNDIFFGGVSLEITGTQEEAPDLVAFAKALAEAGVEVWTTTLQARGRVAEQLSLFEEGEHFLPIRQLQEQVPLEEGGGVRFTQEAIDAGRTRANVWVFPDATESNGALLSLEQISSRSGVPIPTSSSPSIVPIDDVTVLQGSPLHIPLDGYDPNNDNLTYTITVENENLVSTFVPTGNRSLRLMTSDLQGEYGEMIFHLFEGRAGRATDRIIDLTNADFYDGIPVHRIVDQFMIQSGDPTGTGSGGSGQGTFDDQFHLDLQHNRNGVLSMAKSLDDTNDSQFFITEVPTRFLDFQHTVFGQLVEGDRVRESMSNTDVRNLNGENSSPTLPTTIDDAEIFVDQENSIVMLEALGASGTTNVTVTVMDEAGNSSSESFTVTLAADMENGPPFMDDIPDQFFEPGDDYRFSVTTQDAEGDDVDFAATTSTSEVSVSVIDNGSDATIVLDAPPTFAGEFIVTISATPNDSLPFPPGLDPRDNQLVRVTIAPSGPSGVDLVPSSDSGISDSDDITNVTGLEFEVSGVVDGARVILLADGVEVGEGVASGNSIIITTANPSALGNGTHSITAVQEVDGLRSLASPALQIELDQVAPATLSNQAPDDATVGAAFVFDAAHVEEGTSGFRYSLANAPGGMQIDEISGEISWTPANSQRGNQSFDVIATDIAGNSTTTTLDTTVIGEVATIVLETTDLNGDATAGIGNGDDFLLRVLVNDQRSSATGISEAFVDISFDETLVEVTGAVTIGPSYPDDNSGTAGTGIITDVGGSTTNSLGAGSVLLATIPMRSIGTGSAAFTASIGGGDVFFFGETNALDPVEVAVSGATLSILDSGASLAANDDAITVDEDSGETQIPVLNNDVLGPSSGIVNIVSNSDPDQSGTATIAPDSQSILYTPAADFNGVETFTYVIRDAQGAEDTATVTITVDPVNDPPIANDDVFPANLPPYDPNIHGPTDPRFLFIEGNEVPIDLRPIANDDIVPDDFNAQEIITITSLGTEGTSGTVIINPDAGNFGLLYTPAPNFFGNDQFTYTITDSHDPPLSATGTITVEIAQVNDPPTAGNDEFNAPPDRPLFILPDELFANDSAGPLEDGVQDLEIVSVAGAQKGTVVLNSDGTVTYTPRAGETGVDTFTYTVTDNGQTDSFQDANTIITLDDPLETTATVTINLNTGNTRPDAFDDSLSIVGDSVATIVNVLGNDRDDGAAADLRVVSVSDPDQGGTVTLENGVVSYQPAASFVGTERFTYTLSDGDLTDTATVVVTVTDPAVSTNSNFSGVVFVDHDNDGQQDTGEGGIGGVVLNLTGSDVDGNAVSRRVVTDVDGRYNFAALPKGTFTVTQDQPLFYLDGTDTADPLSSASGDDAFTVTVGDDVIRSEGNTFGERGVSPRFAMLANLSSRRATVGFVAASAEGQSQLLSSPLGWEDYSHINVVMSGDGETVTITATDKDSVTSEVSFSARDTSRVHVLGWDDDTVLMRIVAAASAYELRPTSPAAAAVDAVFG